MFLISSFKRNRKPVKKRVIVSGDCSISEIILMLQQSWNGMDESGYEKSIKLYDATTNELLAFAEEPLEMDSEFDYPNLIPNFLINVNESTHELHAEYFTDDEYDQVLSIKSNSSACRKFRLEVFIGNEGMCVPKTVPSNPDDLVVTYPLDYDDFLATPVKVYFCLCSDTPPQPTFLRLQPSSGNTLFSGVADDLTLINSANETVYRN